MLKNFMHLIWFQLVCKHRFYFTSSFLCFINKFFFHALISSNITKILRKEDYLKIISKRKILKIIIKKIIKEKLSLLPSRQILTPVIIFGFLEE